MDYSPRIREEIKGTSFIVFDIKRIIYLTFIYFGYNIFQRILSKLQFAKTKDNYLAEWAKYLDLKNLTEFDLKINIKLKLKLIKYLNEFNILISKKLELNSIQIKIF